MRITTRARSDVSDSSKLTNAFGWQVELTLARLAMEQLYYVTGPPAGLAARLGRAIAIPKAHAHPGHYDAGDVLAELSYPTTLDLLANETVLGTGEGVTGRARSAVVTLGSLSAADSGLSVVLEGQATREGRNVSFRANVERSSVVNPTSKLPEIEGCPLTSGPIVGDGVVLLEVSAKTWLDQVDFDELATGSADVRVDLQPDTPPHNALRRGVSKAIAYRFSYSRD